MKNPSHRFALLLVVVFASLTWPDATATAAVLPVVRDVPRPAFIILQKLASGRQLAAPNLDFGHLPEHAREFARQRHDAGQKELLAAVTEPDWFSASKRAFIEAVAVDGVFEVEVHPLPRPGFKPPAIKLAGRLTPALRDRLRALRPPPFPENGGPRDWIGHGREGWRALLAHARATPAQYNETVAALTAHLRPLASGSRPGNQFKPLQDELARLAEGAKVHDQDTPDVKLRASVLTRALLFAAAQAAARAVQPEVPPYVYARYEVQAVDQKYLPFAEATTAGEPK